MAELKDLQAPGNGISMNYLTFILSRRGREMLHSSPIFAANSSREKIQCLLYLSFVFFAFIHLSSPFVNKIS